MAAPIPDDRQNRVAEAINVRSTKLAGMYRTALQQLAATPEPGCEVARVSTVCHCIRELMTGLLSALADVDIPRPSPSSRALVDRLPALPSRHSYLDIGLDQDLVPVPKKVAHMFNKLVETAVQEQGRNRRLAAGLVTGGDDVKHPAIDQWQDAYRFVLAWTHLDQNHVQNRELPSDEEILAALRVVEDVIEVRSALFFDNVSAIKDLLADINAVEEDELMATFKTPNQGQVKEALRRIPTSQLRRAFFENLMNPNWVEALDREHAFSNPPTAEGMISDIYWPEIDYLIRMSSERPAAVVNVLLKLKESSNSWVRRGTFTIGAQIPANEAVGLTSLLKSWAASGFGWRTDPREMVDFAVNLLTSGHTDVGLWLADRLFKPRKGRSRRGKSGALLEDYWFEKSLPRVADALGPEGLATVLSWLVAVKHRSGRFKKGADLSYLSRDTIRTGGFSQPSIEHVLIDATRDLAVKAAMDDPLAVATLLLSQKMLLARKIAMYAVCVALTQSSTELAASSKLADVVRNLLFDLDSLDEACRIEYAELARLAAELVPDIREKLGPLLAERERLDEPRMREWYRRSSEDESSVAEAVAASQARWRHRWLSSLGVSALTESLRVELADLDAQHGAIESPLAPLQQITSWSGPNSPISQTEMAEMSPIALVAHLESWHPNANRWGPEPSHEGQARELSALLTCNPTALTGVDDLVSKLRPTYLRAVFHGWEAALNADLELDWQQASALISDALQHADESDFPSEGDAFEDDRDFRGAKHAAIRLLQGLARERTKVQVPKDRMAEFADMLITLGRNEKAWNEYISGDGTDMDPLTLSLNWEWPIRVRGLAILVARGMGSPWYKAARAELERELARDDSRGASRAILGENFGRLYLGDKDWVKAQVPTWFGTASGATEGQQIALSTAMAVHRFHPVLFDILAPGILAAIKTNDSIVVGWQSDFTPLQRIGEWIVYGIIRGELTLDDEIPSAFFTTVAPKVRGEAIGHVAWSLMHAESVDDNVLDRLAALWDARVVHVRSNSEDHDELGTFYWFVKSEKFTVAWWLPRLTEALQLHPTLSTERYLLGEDLAIAAEADPRGSLDVLKLLLDGADDAGTAPYDLSQNVLPIVLSRAINSGDDELVSEAVSYMNRLGEKGYLHLDEEVKAAGLVWQQTVLPTDGGKEE
nr:hypothetical protein [Ferrimicrobium acidiphilum]